LMNRPKTEMVGLGLIYGKPGLGKTTYASRIAFMRGYIYMRLGSHQYSQVLRQRPLNRAIPPVQTGGVHPQWHNQQPVQILPEDLGRQSGDGDRDR